MSVLGPTRLALAASIADELPDVQVLAVPPAGNQALKESIWIENGASEFEWRSIGAGPSFAPRNRTETITLELRVQTYHEGPNQLDASGVAIARVEELFDAIETVIESNGGVDHAEFTLGGTVTSSLISRWTVTPRAADAGWIVLGAATFTAQVVI